MGECDYNARNILAYAANGRQYQGKHRASVIELSEKLDGQKCKYFVVLLISCIFHDMNFEDCV